MLLMKARNMKHWEETKDANSWLDFANTTQWRHAKPGKQSPWEDPLVRVYGLSWWDAPSTDLAAWKASRVSFVARLCEEWKLHKPPGAEQCGPTLAGRRAKAPVKIPQWDVADLEWDRQEKSFEFRVDNQLLASWMVGTATCMVQEYQPKLAYLMRTLLHIVTCQGWCLRHTRADWVRWIPREKNVLADALANAALYKGMNIGVEGDKQNGGNFIMVSDGAARSSTGKASAAWAILAFNSCDIQLISGGAILLLGKATALQAEMTGLELAAAAFLLIPQGRTNTFPHEVSLYIKQSEFLRDIDYVLDEPRPVRGSES